MVPWLEKLRILCRAGGRGAVLLRLRVCWVWDEKRGTWGASAAMELMLSSPFGGSSGMGALGNERLPGMGLGRPLATRMESRIGLRLKAAWGGIDDVDSS